MPSREDRQQFKNEDLVLQVSTSVDRTKWDELRYEEFIDELCGVREYQKEAIRTTLRFLLSGEYNNLRDLAKKNYESNFVLEQRYGSWANMQRKLQLPDHLSASIDLATGTGKSFVLYGLAAILLAEGVVDRVLVLCPSNTIEYGLLEKFRELVASNADLRALLPDNAEISAPQIINASQSITAGSICVENYHAILEHVGSSIHDSLTGIGANVAVLNDETHHVANESQSKTKKWKEFLADPSYGFRYIVGVSGTCYINNDYFADVVYRYSLRQAVEERFVKKVAYTTDMPRTGGDNEKWQVIRNRHEEYRNQLRHNNILPLTIIVTQTIARCKDLAEELKAFLIDQGTDPDLVNEQVLAVYNNAPDVLRLPHVDQPNNKVEWIVSVSMLNEGWDVKRVFQIVPHEERAFNSKLLIAQVLGRGLRVPEGWQGAQPEVTIFDHEAWAPRIRHLVNEILEFEKRLTSRVLEDSPYHFELHNIEYSLQTDVVEVPMEGAYRFFTRRYVDLASQADTEDVSVEYERAITGELYQWKTQIQHKTYSPREIANVLFDRLIEADEADDAPETKYTDTWTIERLEQMVVESLERVGAKEATEGMRQNFLQALGTLRRKTSQNVRYTPVIDEYCTVSTTERQADSVSASELLRSKAILYTDQTRSSLIDEQVEFFNEATEPGSRYSDIRVANPYDFKTPLNLAIADSSNERRFMLMLCNPENTQFYDAWLKSTSMRFYEIDFAWKKRNKPKRGIFSPDFFIKAGDLILVLEVKGDEELVEPSEENRKKNEYALAHFARVDHHLDIEDSSIRYKFHFITPKDYVTFFQYLRDGIVEKFRSSLDVVLEMNGGD